MRRGVKGCIGVEATTISSYSYVEGQGGDGQAFPITERHRVQIKFIDDKVSLELLAVYTRDFFNLLFKQFFTSAY